MANGKIRHSNHITDTRAIRHLNSLFPVEWVQREMSPDYGIDIDLELFGYEDGKCVTLGEHIFLQVKGTEHARYGIIHPFGKDFYSDEEIKSLNMQVLIFPIETSLLKLVERMGSAIPVLLLVVNLLSNSVHFICLNDYIKHVLPFQKPNWRQQDTISIYIPVENDIKNENVDICLWYGERAKLYGLFQEFLTLIDDVKYLDGEVYVQNVKRFFESIRYADSWKACNHWSMLEYLYTNMIVLLNNSMINELGQDLLKRYVPDGTNPNDILLVIDNSEMSALTAAQLISCKRLLNSAQNMCSTFENSARHLNLPTQFNWLQTH